VKSRFRRKVAEGTAIICGYKAAYLHFQVKNPKATLICFHGWLDNAASFVPLAEQLHDYEIIAWDFLGHGKSAHRHQGERYHYIDLVPFIEAAVAHVQAKKKILVGHSMGAGACALYAGALGENLDRIILIEGFAPMNSEPEEATATLAVGVQEFKKAANLAKPVYNQIEDAVKIRARVNGLATETAMPLVRRAIKKVRGGITWRADFRLRAPSMIRMTSAQIQNILRSIVRPVLVILGDKGMPQLKIVAEKKSAYMPGAVVSTLPGHHHLHIDSADSVAATMRQFIEN
jgi:pimeloyl-ACP methyl ester carboxylesterase